MNLDELSKAVGVKLTVRNQDELINKTIDKLASKLNSKPRKPIKRKITEVSDSDYHQAIIDFYKRGSTID